MKGKHQSKMLLAAGVALGAYLLYSRSQAAALVAPTTAAGSLLPGARITALPTVRAADNPGTVPVAARTLIGRPSVAPKK